MHEFIDFGLTFTILKTEKVDQQLLNDFYSELSEVDKDLISYYKNLNFEMETYYIIKSSEYAIGYARLVIEKLYANLLEIFITSEFRELGLGTKLLNFITEDLKKNELKFRAVVLPSDRTAKNFYESNSITARMIIMEEKRENSRRRP